MATYFADSSFWIALIDRRDAYHTAAIEWSSKITGKIVTTQAVVLETANIFARSAWRSRVIKLIDHVASRDDVEVIPFNQSLWERLEFVHAPRR